MSAKRGGVEAGRRWFRQRHPHARPETRDRTTDRTGRTARDGAAEYARRTRTRDEEED